MKETLMAVIVLLVFGMAGCSGAGSDAKGEDSASGTADESISVEKGFFDVTITLPASMVDSENIDITIEEAKERGVKEVVVNDDGSLTYRMSKSDHNKMMQELRESFLETIEDLKTSGDYVSIKDIQCSKDFTSITLIVDKEAFENSLDGFAVFGLGLTAIYYQLFDGVQADNIQVMIDLRDAATGEVFDTVVYPDAFETQ